MSKKEILFILIIPGLFHILFPGIWIDFFLLSLFYVSFRTKILPYFFLVFIWGIIYSVATFDDPGKEIFALGVTWYFLASFRFDTDISKFISTIAGCIIYIFTKFCIFFNGYVWNVSVTVIFAIYFVLIHTVISMLFILLIYNFSKNKLVTI